MTEAVATEVDGRIVDGGYGWVVVIPGFLGVSAGLFGATILAFGVFVQPLAHAFGWSRTEIAGASTICNLAIAFGSPFVGRICDRYGSRPVALFSLVAVVLGYIGLARMGGSLLMYYAAWVFLSFVGIGSTTIVWSRAVATWFDRRRGFALGLMLTGTGFVTVIGPPILSSVIANYGWEYGYLVLGAYAALTIPITYWLFYERREKLKLQHRALPDTVLDPNLLTGYTRSEAMRMRRFWQLGIAICLIVACISALILHFVPLIIDAGIDRATAARVFSGFGLSMIIGRMLIGYLLDVYRPAIVAAIVMAIPAFACILLIGHAGVVGVDVAAAILVGFCTGAELDLIAYLTSRYFGIKSFGENYGCMLFFSGISASIGVLAAGYTRDMTGTYNPALYVAMGCFVAGALLIATLGEPAFKYRAR